MNTMAYRIDLNCDLGEGSPVTDAAIMPFISSCNIACGGHAGDRDSMLNCIELASRENVAIGAHPGYPDPENFGRLPVNISADELKDSLAEQIQTLKSLAQEQGAQLVHVKPHGALYNAAADDPVLAGLIAETIVEIDTNLIYVGLSASAMFVAANKYNLNFSHEAFIDRAYTSTARLVSRATAGAVLTDTDQMYARSLNLIRYSELIDINEQVLTIGCDTLCIHGDHPGAIQTARGLLQFLNSQKIEVKAVRFGDSED